jgi:hypothetical protein
MITSTVPLTLSVEPGAGSKVSSFLMVFSIPSTRTCAVEFLSCIVEFLRLTGAPCASASQKQIGSTLARNIVCSSVNNRYSVDGVKVKRRESIYICFTIGGHKSPAESYCLWYINSLYAWWLWGFVEVSTLSCSIWTYAVTLAYSSEYRNVNKWPGLIRDNKTILGEDISTCCRVLSLNTKVWVYCVMHQRGILESAHITVEQNVINISAAK